MKARSAAIRGNRPLPRIPLRSIQATCSYRVMIETGGQPVRAR